MNIYFFYCFAFHFFYFISLSLAFSSMVSDKLEIQGIYERVYLLLFYIEFLLFYLSKFGIFLHSK